MELVDYMYQNPFGLPIPPSDYDEEFVVTSINSFIINHEVIDNLILNQLTNQKPAPNRLIKKTRGKWENANQPI